MRKYKMLCCAVVLLLSTSVIGHAANPDGNFEGIDPDVLISVLKNLGASSNEVINSKNCMVTVNFNQYKIIQNIPNFKKIGFISDKVSESYYASHINNTLVVLSLEVASYRTLAF